MVQEIEIKALLTEEKYDELKRTLPLKFRKINEDSITTIKFKPKDVRVRYSQKLREVVFKDGDPTIYSRNEISINLGSIDDCRKMVALLEEMGLEQEPSWTKEKQEFLCEFNGNEYTLSLQFIPNFAYIIEAEIMADESGEHINNLKKLLLSIGCEPIEPADFKARIKEYIEKFSKK
jgi:adenylate cyclase class IV